MPSSNNPPPWLAITGISRAAMKDNAQVNAAEYDGNARPAELVVEQNTLDLYVGDNNGNLILLATTSGAAANISAYDEGVLLTNTITSFNFVGAGITATANVADAVTVTVPSTAVTIVDENGNTLSTSANAISFTGPGVEVTNVGNAITVNVTAGPVESKDEGTTLTGTTESLNFVGEGVTATNVGNAVTVTVGAGISSLYYGSFYFDTETALTAGMNSNTTAPIPVTSTAGFAASGYLRIDGEVIQYTGKTATTFTGITRGVAGSNGSTHSNGDKVSAAQVTAAGVAEQVLIDETDIANGVTLDSATGNITVTNAGVYNIQFSAQVENFGNDFGDTVIWFKINGNNLPATASYCSSVAQHGGTPGSNIVTVNIFQNLAANDVIALGWTSVSGTTTLSSIPTVGSTIPQSPAVIVTVNRIA